MKPKTLAQRPTKRATQFSVFTANRLGRLHDLTSLLASHQVHIVAITVLDTTDSTIIRLVVDDTDRARELLNEHNFPFTECEIVAVEVDSETKLKDVLSALLEAEINIHYTYSFISRPKGRAALVLNIEDRDVAEQALKRHHIHVLYESDICR